MNQQDKERIVLRVEPELREKIDWLVEHEGYKSVNKFATEAIREYIDRLLLRESGSLLPREISSAIDGRLGQFEDSYARLSFKTAVELDMLCGILADAFKLSDEDLRRRRADSVKNVKRTNGSLSLEQRMRSSDVELDLSDEGDDAWQG